MAGTSQFAVGVPGHEALEKVVPELTEGGVHVVFDAVGGMLGAKALASMRPKGRMMVFGALALDNMSINSGLLIFRDLKIEGFWLSTWIEEMPESDRAKAFRNVFGFLMKEDSKIDVEGKFTLGQFKEALVAYETPGRNGKILLVS